MLTRDEISLLEELNFNAWPALRTAHYDGWLLRCTGGQSRRVNSVNPLTRGVLPLSEKIKAAEEIYARWGRPTVFRLTPLAETELDGLVADKGYEIDGPTFVQVASLEASLRALEVVIAPRPEEAWIKAALSIRSLSGEDAEVFAAQHRAIGIESGWALIHSEAGAPVAVGAVAIERGWAGLHGIYVAKAARRAGIARNLSEALLAHAYERGARRAWLQVEQNNAPALPLYAGLGFRTAYEYHHRVRRG
jgi:N-acetylglutamate synthase